MQLMEPENYIFYNIFPICTLYIARDDTSLLYVNFQDMQRADKYLNFNTKNCKVFFPIPINKDTHNKDANV